MFGGSSGSKRFATVQLSVAADGSQPRTAVIFRGQGKRISAVEKAAWDSRVDVYFQPKAWADDAFQAEFMSQTVKEFIKRREAEDEDDIEFLMFLDNLKHQTTQEFRRLCKGHMIYPWWLPVQPI